MLADEDLVVLMPAGHPLARRDGVSPEDIRDVRPVTFPTGFTLRWIIDQWYRRAGYSPIVAAETGSLNVVLRLVEGGVGLGIVPRSLSWRGLAAGLGGLPLAQTSRCGGESWPSAGLTIRAASWCERWSP